MNQSEVYLKQDSNYKLEDVDRFASMLMPDKIEYPDAFLVLGTLTGIVLSDRYTWADRTYTAKAITKLSASWVELTNSHRAFPITYAETLHNQFVVQMYTMAGLVHTLFGTVATQKNENKSNHSDGSYYDKGPRYEE